MSAKLMLMMARVRTERASGASPRQSLKMVKLLLARQMAADATHSASDHATDAARAFDFSLHSDASSIAISTK